MAREISRGDFFIINWTGIAFTGDRIKTHRVSVDDQDAVQVWDNTARHYSRCHALSKYDMCEILRIVDELRLGDDDKAWRMDVDELWNQGE